METITHNVFANVSNIIVEIIKVSTVIFFFLFRAVLSRFFDFRGNLSRPLTEDIRLF